MKLGRPGAGRVDDRLAQPRGREGQIGVAGEVAGHGGLEIDDGRGRRPAHGRDRLGAGRHHDVAAQHQPRAAGGDPRCADLVLASARS